jgi:hypothetical protein
VTCAAAGSTGCLAPWPYSSPMIVTTAPCPPFRLRCAGRTFPSMHPSASGGINEHRLLYGGVLPDCGVSGLCNSVRLCPIQKTTLKSTLETPRKWRVCNIENSHINNSCFPYGQVGHAGCGGNAQFESPVPRPELLQRRDSEILSR